MDALQSNWHTAVIALIGCLIILAGNTYQIPYLSNQPSWLLTAAAYIATFSTAILLSSIIRLPIIGWQAFIRMRQRAARRAEIESLFSSSPIEEKALLAYLYSTGQKHFTAELNHVKIVPIASKGFIKPVPGYNDIINFPYRVSDDIWNIMEENHHEFYSEELRTSPNPLKHQLW